MEVDATIITTTFARDKCNFFTFFVGLDISFLILMEIELVSIVHHIMASKPYYASSKTILVSCFIIELMNFFGNIFIILLCEVVCFHDLGLVSSFSALEKLGWILDIRVFF
jgi:hypothetical protein